MNQLKPEKLTPEKRQQLHELGMNEYKPSVLPRCFNPTSSSYWYLHGGLLIGAITHRLYIRKFINAPHALSTGVIFALLYAMYKDQYKLDYLHFLTPWRPIRLEDHLETSPITRNAYQKALKENENYQMKLQSKIEELKSNNNEEEEDED